MSLIDTNDGRRALKKILAFIVGEREYFEKVEFGKDISEWTDDNWADAAESAYYTMTNVYALIEEHDPRVTGGIMDISLEGGMDMEILYYLVEEGGLSNDDVFSYSSVFELCGESLKWSYDSGDNYDYEV